jgi:hypothetical protein
MAGASSAAVALSAFDCESVLSVSVGSCSLGVGVPVWLRSLPLKLKQKG